MASIWRSTNVSQSYIDLIVTVGEQCCNTEWTAYPLFISVFTCLVSAENKHTLTLHQTLVYALASFRGQEFRRFLDAMPCRTTGLMPFSSCLPPMGSPLCQLGLEQMGWFSMASHQPTQWHVKQAVTGLTVPGTAILYGHMGIMCSEITVDRQTGAWFVCISE